MNRTHRRHVLAALSALWRDRAGVTAVEYAMIAAIIAIAIVAAAAMIGSNLSNIFFTLENTTGSIG